MTWIRRLLCACVFVVACASARPCSEFDFWSLVTRRCRAEVKTWSVTSRARTETNLHARFDATCPRYLEFGRLNQTCAREPLDSEATRDGLKEEYSSSTKLTPLVILSPDEFKNQVLERHNTADTNAAEMLDNDAKRAAEENASGAETALEIVTEEDSHVLVAEKSDDLVDNVTESAEVLKSNPEEYHEDDEHEHAERFNYASFDAGAVIMASSEAFKSTSNLLTENRDKYSLAPCKSKKWVVVGLSEDILVDTIVIANFERYSSTVRQFLVLGSHQYPATEWSLLGKFEAGPEFGEQTFVLQQKVWARYLKFRFVTHYEDEFYCTLSVIRVFGSTHIESIRQEIEESSKSMERIKSVAGQASIEANGNGTTEGSYPELPSSPSETVNGANDTAEAKSIDSSVGTASAAPSSQVEEDNADIRTTNTSSAGELEERNESVILEDDESGKAFVLLATDKPSEVDKWLCSLRITRLSTCSENYTMISENLNVGESSPRAYLCARFANTTYAEDSAKDGSKRESNSQSSSAAVQEVKVLKGSTRCPRSYLTAGVLAQNVSICYRRASAKDMENGTVKLFAHLNVRKNSSTEGRCSFCAPIARFFCVGDLEHEGSAEALKQVTRYDDTVIQQLEEEPPNVDDGDAVVKEDSKSHGGEARGTVPNPPTVPGGSVESIFKTLTSKVLQLELDQSLLKQYVESVVQKYADLFRELQEGLDKATEESTKLGSVVAANDLQIQQLERLRDTIEEEQLARTRLEEELQVWRNISVQTRQMLGDMAILLVFSLLVSCGAVTIALRKSCK